MALKEKLLKHGYQFYSETDTEVVIRPIRQLADEGVYAGLIQHLIQLLAVIPAPHRPAAVGVDVHPRLVPVAAVWVGAQLDQQLVHVWRPADRLHMPADQRLLAPVEWTMTPFGLMADDLAQRAKGEPPAMPGSTASLDDVSGQLERVKKVLL